MMLIILVFLTLIQIKFGLLVLTQTTLWLMVFFLSNFIIGINPLNKQFYIVRIMSIIVIIFILYYNTLQMTISTALILPLSINKITYFDDLIGISKLNIYGETKTMALVLDKSHICNWLNSLDSEQNYIVNFQFVPELSEYNLDAPQMIISKPILINKMSSPTTISKFLDERLNLMVDCYYLDDTIIQDMKNNVGPVILFNYTEFSTD